MTVSDGGTMITNNLVSSRYRLHEQLGAGGMGVVWRATDELLGRQIAIKRIRLDVRGGEPVEIIRQRTLREARIAAQLFHPHVVSIFDVLTVDGDPWLVLEYLPSDSLSDAIEAHGALDPRMAAGLGVAVADALAAAHAAGIVHRDVKPGNVLLGRTGAVKLTDFGISHAMGDVSLTGTNVLTGTPAFLAPEMARGYKGGAASDVYSLGATLYAAVEGAPPFGPNANVLRVLQLIAAGQVPPPRRAGPLAPMLKRLMDIDPARRPSAIEARELLREVAEQPAAETTRIVALHPNDLPPGRRGPPPAVPAYPGAPSCSGSPPWPGQLYAEPPIAPPRPCVSRRWRTAMIVAAAAVLTAGLVVGVTTAGSPTPAPPANPASTNAAPAPAPVIPPDPRTADPCSLVDPAPLATFGQAELVVDFNDFSACQMEVEPPSGGFAIVTARFEPRLDPGLSPPGVVEIRGDRMIGRTPEDDGYCERTVMLPDRTQIKVSASLRDGVVGDACAMAETATETALSKLTTTGIGQRAGFDSLDSLALLDGCTLLDAAALTTAGVDASDPAPGYANWNCTWSGTTSEVELSLARQERFGSEDGQMSLVAGRDVFVLPGSYTGESDTCLVQVPGRRFRASDGEQRVEKLQIGYTGIGTPEELCRTATGLASNAIPKLPPIQ